MTSSYHHDHEKQGASVCNPEMSFSWSVLFNWLRQDLSCGSTAALLLRPFCCCPVKNTTFVLLLLGVETCC